MSDQFYEDGTYDSDDPADAYVGEDDPVEEFGTFVDEHGVERLATEGEVAAALGQDWRERWAAEDAAAREQARDESIAAMADQYAHQRLGQLTRSIVEQGGPGLEQIHLPHLHDTTAQLLGSRDWLLGHGMPSNVRNAELAEYVQSRGEPLIAAALTDALTSLTPGQNENEALERYLLRKGG